MKCFMTGKPCDFQMEETETPSGTKPGVFIASPFGFPFDSIYGSSDRVNSGEDKNVVQEALRSDPIGLEPKRADQAVRLGSIMCQGICKEILQRDYLLADLTKPNPNVYYELGLAYALKKRVICCVNEEIGNNYLDIFKNAWAMNDQTVQGEKLEKDAKEKQQDGKNCSSGYITYRTHTELIKCIKSLDKCSVPKIKLAEKHGKFGERKIIIVENGESEISGIFEELVKDVLNDADFTFDNDLLKSLNDRDKMSFNPDAWKGCYDEKNASVKGWTIKTLRITNKSSLSEIVDCFSNARICIVDTSSYGKENTEQSNPYMFFCLGMAHGMEKDVIPITNTLHSNPTPFDVTGLWHVFYSRMYELKTGFLRIFPRICIDYHREIEENPYRQIWDWILREKRRVTIFYCGRSAQRENEETFRTSIDSWDSKAVSEASFYLAQKYPTTLIRPEPPKTKKGGKPSEEFIEKIRNDLSGNYSNCIVVGSPDVSDYSEVVLSEIFKVKPYEKRKTLRANHEGFIFYKKNISKDIQSAFFTPCDADEREWVAFPGQRPYIEKDTSYGVLVIARNPFDSTKWVLVLSGYTGLATCGLMQLLIDTEVNEKIKNLSNKYCLKNQINNKFTPTTESSPFIALVQFKFESITNPIETSIPLNGKGDTREITEVNVIEAMHVPVPDQDSKS